MRVVEARSRLGGRTLTVSPGDGAGAFDLGATWIWADQPEVLAAVAELGIDTFPQHEDGRHLAEEEASAPPAAVVAPPSAPALRLAGGAQQVCQRLADRLEPGSITFGTTAVAIDATGPGVTVTTQAPSGSGQVGAGGVVAVPPRLALEKILFTPPLPDDLVHVMRLTPNGWPAPSSASPSTSSPSGAPRACRGPHSVPWVLYEKSMTPRRPAATPAPCGACSLVRTGTGRWARRREPTSPSPNWSGCSE